MDKFLFIAALSLSCLLWWYREPVQQIDPASRSAEVPLTREALPQPPPQRQAMGPQSATAKRYAASRDHLINNNQIKRIPVASDVAKLLRAGTLEWANHKHLRDWAQAVHFDEANRLAVRHMPSPEGLTRPAFVINGPMQIPQSLREPHTLIFYVAKGAPLPTGELGYAQILDFNTLQCHGTGCFTPDR